MREKNYLSKHTDNVIRLNERKLRKGEFKLNTVDILVREFRL